MRMANRMADADGQLGTPAGKAPSRASGHPEAGDPDLTSTGRIIGALFLAAFIAYGTGSLLVESVTGADDLVGSAMASATRIQIGSLLMLANSVIVAAIGVLMLRVVSPRRPTIAVGYLVARAFEAVLLAVGIVGVLLVVPAAAAGEAALTRVLAAGNDQAFQLAMVGLGVGSIPLFWVLGTERLIPRSLAAWGAGGYAIFAIGSVLEIVGVSVGLVLAAPAGLFEVALAIYLLVRSMPLDRTRDLAP